MLLEGEGWGIDRGPGAVSRAGTIVDHRKNDDELRRETFVNVPSERLEHP